jgi:hypothetical protein
MKRETANHVSRGRRGLVFLTLQVGFGLILVVAARAKLTESEARRSLPPLRRVPLSIGPLHNDPAVISDEQLRTVLFKLRPRLPRVKPNIYDVDHALRFWGPRARFPGRDCLSGVELRGILVDHASFVGAWGRDAKPLLIRDAQGVGFRLKDGLASSSHIDHVLAVLGEVGTELDFPIATPTGRATLGDVLVRSLRAFDLNQSECDFSALAYALYVAPPGSWVSAEGQEITFDRIADRLMREKLSSGCCCGTHRLYDLVVFLRVDKQYPILSSQCRERICRHLRAATALLVASQRRPGNWDPQWADGARLAGEDEVAPQHAEACSDGLLVTGHVLEWWAIAPDEFLPPREVIVRAAQWLTDTVLHMDRGEIQKGYAFLSHVGRALALWRGRVPADLIDRFKQMADPSPSAGRPTADARGTGSDARWNR